MSFGAAAGFEEGVGIAFDEDGVVASIPCMFMPPMSPDIAGAFVGETG